MNFSTSAAETVTMSRSVPLELSVPSVTAMVATPACTSRMTPFRPRDTLATPLVKLSEVAVPNGRATPERSMTVGGSFGFDEESAPEKVNDRFPVNATGFPAESVSVIVRFCVVPAVCVLDPAMMYLAAAPD